MEYEEHVKETYLAADSLYRYYAKLAARFYQFNLWMLFFISILSVGAVIASLSPVPNWTTVVLASIAAIVAFMIPVLDFSRRAGVAASITAQCMEVSHGWEQLWWATHTQEHTPANLERWGQRFEELSVQMMRATAPAALQNGFINENLQKKAGEEAQTYWEFAHGRA